MQGFIKVHEEIKIILVKRKTALKLRKAYRFLGLFIGIQFIMWTVRGMYFSWTDIDEIHGDHFRKHHVEQVSFRNLIAPAELPGGVKSFQLKDIVGKPFYLVNDEKLIDAETGEEKQAITEGEALTIAGKYMRKDWE